MDILSNLILIKNSNTKEYEDKTAEISNLRDTGSKVAVIYLGSSKTYNYKSSNVYIFKNPKSINLNQLIISIDGFPIKNPASALDFGRYIKIIDTNQSTETYHNSRVTFQSSCLNAKQPKDIFDYLKELSAHVAVMDDGRKPLFDQYEKLAKVSEESVLAIYLSKGTIIKTKNSDTPIFPFGINLSQKKAVETALENSISIIKGPPGTGKTQTILNIIANIVSKGKTVAVVSGNNSATLNVQEKLEKNDYEFITALLGNSDKKIDFFKNKQRDIPNITVWAQEPKQIKILSEQVSSVSENLNALLEDKNKIAKLQEELSKLKIEQTYFENSLQGEYVLTSKYSFYRQWTSDLILDFMASLERIALAGGSSNFKVKVFWLFKYGIYKFNLISKNQKDIVASLKRDYYKRSIEDREKQISFLKTKLENKNYKALMKKYADISSKLFKANLHKKYSQKSRRAYTVRNFKHNFQDFIRDYPVILSTTHSVMTSVSENYLFDYLIVDEASQVDLVTASLALSCCKNVVIVGDIMQLDPIVEKEPKKISDDMLYTNNTLGEAYNYGKYSIIASLMKLYKKSLPTTLLSEHYRCHPKIIGFCNEKFYEKKLVIMTEENPEDTPLKVYKTAPGNHARKDKTGKEKGWYNLRQIEVIRDEIIAKHKDCSTVGIISPYRIHVTETKKKIREPELEVDTVHKFQGREKDTIIFTTVVNDITPFVNKANLINVAVSRAVKELIVVTSNKLFKQHGNNVGDLIRYIEYNSLQDAIIISQKLSVFDLLYSEYSHKLLKIMTSLKHVSEYKSENLMYSVLEEVLASPNFTSFKCVLHVPLNSIIKDFSALNPEERSFAENPWTHVDFLLFNKLDKEPVLAVEIDGHDYHRNSERQQKRDALKDKILKQINLPIIRIYTNESGEKEKIVKKLNLIVKLSAKADESI